MTETYRLPVIASHWRSLEELHAQRTPAHDEFAADASLPPEGLARRSLLQLAGASIAASGLAGCFRAPSEKVLPYSQRPPGITPGLPLHYATGLVQEGFTTGLVIRNVEGRPIKVEGNPAHPASLGATGAREQASLLDLYDPDRARLVTERGTPRSRRDLLDFLSRRGAESGDGARLRFLVEPTASPLLASLREGILQRFPRARVVAFAPDASLGAARAAAVAFGSPLEQLRDFSAARVVVSLDEDFLMQGPGAVRAARDFVNARSTPASNRLYVAESSMSLTGAFSDQRLRVRPGALVSVARALAVAVGSKLGHPLLSGLQEGAPLGELQRAWVRRAAADLLGARGFSLVLAGGRQDEALHTLALALNEALGNRGKTLRLIEPLLTPAADPEELARLLSELRAGHIDTLVITAWNPVFAAPPSLGFAEALKKVAHVVYRAPLEDESSALCEWFAPATHPYESWGDGRAPDGTASILQPLIAPLFESSVDEVELLSPFAPGSDQAPTADASGARGAPSQRAPRVPLPAGGFAGSVVDASGASAPALDAGVLLGPAPGSSGPLATAPGSSTAPGAAPAAGTPLDAAPGARTYQRLRALWRQRAGDPADFETRWEGWLAEGVIPGTAAAMARPSLRTEAMTRALQATDTAPSGGMWLDLVPDPRLLGGRLANNPWLQELPDPLTQLTWGNAALLSPAEAKRLGVRNGQWVRLSVGDATLEAPVLVAPGQADDTVTLALGHGRRAGGAVAKGVGVDAGLLRSHDAPWMRQGLSITVLDRHTPLALAQEHGRMEGRELALQTTRASFEAHPETFEHLRRKLPRLYPSMVPTTGYQWGMAIDLDRCTGCSACVIACQSENNIPSVGKEQVLRGREMHWLRIDRYFMGDEHDPGVITQPVACVHCENAPCEYVCPVNATVHSPEGLNEMVYNRCVGTRYCSNNCPYKVRRFNFLEYRPKPTVLERMALNPDVTVRSRGVMEKCTYCVQRIEAARVDSRIQGRDIREGEVRTACQQVCPTEAITFGNLTDPRSAVRAAHENPRHYQLLHELGTQPRTVHLARLKNPGEAE